jgi:predicted DsbA family dithiol-disulfide isomerase
MNDRALTIDVYSDVICPWCYVGKRRLESALARLGGAVHARVMWRPFQLNPTMPKEGMDRRTYLQAKFGSLEVFDEMEQRLLEAGDAERISFAFRKIVRTPNTFLAHRLIWHAGLHDRQNELVESLFRGYFEEGADIGSPTALAQLADRAGLKAETVFRGDEGVAEVKEEEAVGRRLGIRAVPHFVLNQAVAVSGAQPPEVLIAAIEKSRLQQKTRSAVTS